MTRQANKILIFMFLLFIFSFSILIFIIPDREFSEAENRMLAKMPTFNMKNIISGKFSKKFETYITDQFVFRDFWVGIKSDSERLTLKGENNGIFFGKDGYLLEDYKKPGKSLDETIDSINSFSKKFPNIPTYLLLAPNSVKVYEDKLPIFASPYDELKTIEYVKNDLNKDIKFADIYDKLYSKKDEYIYFKTDHHWTMRGAYYAYEMLAKKIGIKPYDISEFNSEFVTDEFYGTFYSKAGNRHLDYDNIEILKPKFNTNYIVCYLDTQVCTQTLYQLNHLETKDKYAVFLDGNHSLMTIKSDVKNGKKLVVFKDSYAHSLIPFLANHYEEIHVIDLRYYKMNIYDYIKENSINESLFLYNVSTFSEDENITLLKKQQ